MMRQFKPLRPSAPPYVDLLSTCIHSCNNTVIVARIFTKLGTGECAKRERYNHFHVHLYRTVLTSSFRGKSHVSLKSMSVLVSVVSMHFPFRACTMTRPLPRMSHHSHLCSTHAPLYPSFQRMRDSYDAGL